MTDAQSPEGAAGTDQAPPTAPRRSVTTIALLFKNAAYVLGTEILFIPIALAVVSYTIHKLGLRTYGGWAIMSIVFGYVNLLQFGMARPLINYLAEYRSRGETEAVSVLMSTTLAYFSFIAAVVFVSLTVLGPWLLKNFVRLDIPQWQQHLAYMVVLTDFTVSFVTNVFYAAMTGAQRYDIRSKIFVVTRLANAAGSPLVLALGFGLPGVAIQNFCVTLAETTIVVVSVRRILPEATLSRRYVSRRMFGTMFSFAKHMHIGQISSLVTNQYGTTLLSSLLGPVQYGLFHIGDGVAERLTKIPNAVVGIVSPAASDLYGAGRETKVPELFLRSLRYIALFSMPMTIGAFVFVHPFMNVWLGPAYGRSANSAIIVGISLLVAVPSGPAGAILIGLGRPQYWSYASIVSLVLNLSVTTVAILTIGFYGAAIGIASAWSGSAVVLLYFIHRELRLSPLTTIRTSVGGPFLAAVAAAALAWLAFRQLGTDTWIAFGTIGLGYGLVYTAAVALAVADEYDWGLVRRLWTGLRSGRGLRAAW